ncbi:5480_t:CDS:2, partial [Paraglomus occultum]
MPPTAYTRPYRQEYSEPAAQANGRRLQFKNSLPPRPYQNSRTSIKQQGNMQQQQYLQYQQRQQYQQPQQAYNQIPPQAPPRRRPRSQTLPEPFYQFIESDITAEPPFAFRGERQPFPENRPLPIPPSGFVPQTFVMPPVNSDPAVPSGRLSQPQLSPIVETDTPRYQRRRQPYPHKMRHSASLPNIRYVEIMDAPPTAAPYEEPSPTSSMFGHAESSVASSPRRARPKSWSSRGSG